MTGKRSVQTNNKVDYQERLHAVDWLTCRRVSQDGWISWRLRNLNAASGQCRRFLASHFSQFSLRQPGPRTRMYRTARSKIGKSKSGSPITSISCTQQREQAVL